MYLGSAKKWCIWVTPAALFFVCYYCPQYCFPSKPQTAVICAAAAEQNWEKLNLNVSRQQQLFLKLENYFWREHFSPLPLPYGIRGCEEILLKLLGSHRMVEQGSMPAHIESLQCRSCIVVGNSFMLKNSSLGAAINAHDIVIRMNNSPVRGYERDVGNKTTIRLFYPESAVTDPGIHNDPDTLMVLVPFKPQDLLWLKEILFNERRIRRKVGYWRPPPQIWLGELNQLRILDPHYLHITATKLLNTTIELKQKKKIWPTTGLLAIFLALNYCDMVDVAGFGYPLKTPRQPVHYYGSDTLMFTEGTQHDFNRETKLLQRLEELRASLGTVPDSEDNKKDTVDDRMTSGGKMEGQLQ